MNLSTRACGWTFGLWLASGCHGGDEASTTGDPSTTTTVITTGENPTSTTMAATTTVAPTTEAETTGGTVPTTSGATDVGPTATDSGGTDTTSTSADTTTDTTSTDADTTTIDTDTGVEAPCSLPTPIGEDAMGLIVEPCEVLGDPLRGLRVEGFAIDTKGAILVNLTDQATIRLVDSAAPGCALTRAPADDLPPAGSFGEWGPIEVLADGTIYEMNTLNGDKGFISSGTKNKECPDIDLYGGNDIGFRAGQAIAGSFNYQHPILFDFDTCTAEVITAIPVVTWGAMFYDDDVIISEEYHLHRWTLEGVKVWEAYDDWQLGTGVVRCGDDICVMNEWGAYFGRYAGADGKLVEQYHTIPLFGFEAIIDALGTSPDHAAILVGFEVEHPDPACSADDMKNIQFYRVSGF